MSRRRPPDEDELDEEEEEDEDVPDEDEVEYLVEELDDDSVRTSVPKSLHSSQRSSSAPSTLTVVSDDFEAPHISHWGIPLHSRALRIKDAPAAAGVAPGAPAPDPSRSSPTDHVRSDHAPQNRCSAVR
jgi:hypothetical protein